MDPSTLGLWLSWQNWGAVGSSKDPGSCLVEQGSYGSSDSVVYCLKGPRLAFLCFHTSDRFGPDLAMTDPL